MSIISEIKCARCDRKYSGIRSRCPYCGARRIGRGKYSEDTDNSRGKMLIGVLIMSVAVVAAGILIFTAPPFEESDGGAQAVAPPSNSTNGVIPDDLDNETVDGVHDIPIESESPSPLPQDTPSAPPATQVKSVKIVYGQRNQEKKDITEKIGVRLPLKVQIEPIGAMDEVIWTSSNEEVFKVTPTSTDGHYVNIVGLKEGTATLTVSVGDAEAKCIIRMKKG